MKIVLLVVVVVVAFIAYKKRKTIGEAIKKILPKRKK